MRGPEAVSAPAGQVQVEKTAAREPAETDRQAAQIVAQVKEVCSWLSRLSRAFRLYTPNNRLIQTMVDNLTELFDKYFLKASELSLQITPTELLLGRETVYENEDRGQSLSFKLFKDGIRRIAFQRGLARNEITRLLDILGINFESKEYMGEDTSTMLWKAEFRHINFRIVKGFQDIADQAETDADYKVVADSIFSDSPEGLKFEGFGDIAGEGSLASIFGEESPAGQAGGLGGAEDGKTSIEAAADGEKTADKKPDGEKKPDSEDIARAMQMMDAAESAEEGGEEASLLVSPEETELLIKELDAEDYRHETLELIRNVLSDAGSCDQEQIKETLAFIDSAIFAAIEKKDVPLYFAVIDALYILVDQKKTPSFERREDVKQLIEDQLVSANFLRLCSSIDPADTKQIAKFSSFLRAMGKVPPAEVLELIARVDDEGDRSHLTALLPGLVKGDLAFFLDKLYDRRLAVVKAVIFSLKKIGTDQAVEGIVKALRHPNPDIRIEAVRASAGRYNSMIRGALLASLMDKVSAVRRAVIGNFVESEDSSISEELKKLSLEQDFLSVSIEEKVDVMKAIALLGGEEYIPFFRKMVRQWAFRNRMLKDEVRIAALEAISVFDHPISRLVVRQAADSGNLRLRSAAESIIQRWEKEGSKFASG